MLVGGRGPYSVLREVCYLHILITMRNKIVGFVTIIIKFYVLGLL
jgi:hypothetical protein